MDPPTVVHEVTREEVVPYRRNTERSVVRKAREYRKLAADPPCKICEMPRSEHANDKCLFGPGQYAEPTHVSLRVFFRRGTYRHE